MGTARGGRKRNDTYTYQFGGPGGGTLPPGDRLSTLRPVTRRPARASRRPARLPVFPFLLSPRPGPPVTNTRHALAFPVPAGRAVGCPPGHAAPRSRRTPPGRAVRAR